MISSMISGGVSSSTEHELFLLERRKALFPAGVPGRGLPRAVS
jgi:hypothetical protein